MKIGELAQRTGVGRETIRFYEKIGVLPQPVRTSGNYRDYTDEHVVRLIFVRQARDLGFELDEIEVLLRLKEGSACKVAAEQIEQLRARAKAKIDALQTLLDELQRPAAHQ